MKGTPSMGKHNKKGSHIRCRRCGRHTYHVNKKTCSSCGHGNSARIRSYKWQTGKSIRSQQK